MEYEMNSMPPINVMALSRWMLTRWIEMEPNSKVVEEVAFMLSETVRFGRKKFHKYAFC